MVIKSLIPPYIRLGGDIMRRGVCKNILYSNALELIKNKKVVVIDVRDSKEITYKKLEGSINIPFNELNEKINSIVPDKNQPILVYCATGSRSIFACQMLANHGYNTIYNLYGGIV